MSRLQTKPVYLVHFDKVYPKVYNLIVPDHLLKDVSMKIKQQSLYLELAHIKHNIAPKLGFSYDTVFKYQPKKMCNKC